MAWYEPSSEPEVIAGMERQFEEAGGPFEPAGAETIEVQAAFAELDAADVDVDEELEL